MEWPQKQLEFWPKKISLEELNEELERAAKQGERKREDLVPEEEITRALEGKEAKPIKISQKKNLEEVRKIIKKLEGPEGDAEKGQKKND